MPDSPFHLNSESILRRTTIFQHSKKRDLETNSLNINYVWEKVPVRGIFVSTCITYHSAEQPILLHNADKYTL